MANTFLRLVLVGAACVLIQGCASEQRVQSQGTVASAPAAVTAAGQTRTAQPSRIQLEDKTLTPLEAKTLIGQGYKPVSRNGEIYYCRQEQQFGSHFSTVTCKTGQDLKVLAQQGQDLTAQRQRLSDVVRSN